MKNQQIPINSELTSLVLQQACDATNDWLIKEHSSSFTPIIISRKARRNYSQEKSIETHPWMTIATGCYLRFEDRYWLVTANHVIDKLEKEHNRAPIYGQNGQKLIELFNDSVQFNIVRFSSEDVAVIRLENIVDFDHVRWIEPGHIIHAPSAQQFRVGLYGYLRKRHKSVSNSVDIVQYLTRVCEPNKYHGSHQVCVDFDRRAFEGDVTDRTFVPQPDGLSGGPVFGLGTVNELAMNTAHQLRFCGMLIEQSDRCDRGVFVDANYLFRCITCAAQELKLIAAF